MKLSLATFMTTRFITVLVLITGMLQPLSVFAIDNPDSETEVTYAQHDATQRKSAKRNSTSKAINTAQFGRLFTSPQERARLDLQRQQHGFSKPIITDISADHTDTNAASMPAQPQSYRLSGILLRADGQQQVWINGKLQPLQKQRGVSSNQKNSMPSSATLRVPVKQQDQSVQLKPGQVWSHNNHKTTESYLLPVSRPPEPVKKPIEKKETPQEKPAAPSSPESVEKIEAAPEAPKAAP